MKPAPPVISRVATGKCEPRRTRSAQRKYLTLRASRSLRLDGRALRVLERQPQLFGERIDRGAGALPGAVGLEPQIADAATPRRDHAADRAEVAALGVLLIEPAD